MPHGCCSDDGDEEALWSCGPLGLGCQANNDSSSHFDSFLPQSCQQDVGDQSEKLEVDGSSWKRRRSGRVLLVTVARFGGCCRHFVAAALRGLDGLRIVCRALVVADNAAFPGKSTGPFQQLHEGIRARSGRPRLPKNCEWLMCPGLHLPGPPCLQRRGTDDGILPRPALSFDHDRGSEPALSTHAQS